MWYTYREIHSLGKNLGENHIKEEGIKSCEDQEASTEWDTKIEQDNRG